MTYTKYVFIVISMGKMFFNKSVHPDLEINVQGYSLTIKCDTALELSSELPLNISYIKITKLH